MKLNFVLIGLLFFWQGCSTHTPQKNNLTVTIDGIMYQNEPFTSKDENYYNKGFNEGGRVWRWENAKKYCEDLTLNSYNDWKLPNDNELVKLLIKKQNVNHRGYKYYIKKDFLNNMPIYETKYYPNLKFWTSLEKNSRSALFVDFYSHVVDWHYKNNKNYVLCIRGIQDD